MKIAGFDEVGRGAWAGPLVVAGVVLDDTQQTSFRDSKHYAPAARQRALRGAYDHAVAIGIATVPADEIDKRGLGPSLALAFRLAQRQLGVEAEQYIVDGAINYLEHITGSRAEPKADDNYQSVAAASIVAKVHRDEFMAIAASRFGGYGFERHVGYGTALHRDSLHQFGVCELHRRSFKPVASMT